jgi:transcriptional regulator GlxA family with amidase domain
MANSSTEMAVFQRVHMSPRNFARVYAAKRGRTPAKAVEAIRVDEARRRLEETDDRRLAEVPLGLSAAADEIIE